MTDRELQSDELLALSSIYDESVISVSQEGNEFGGQFIANLQLNEKLIVKYKDLKSGKEDVVELQFLPPVTLNFQYPTNYPSTAPPEFTLSCKWLSRKQLSALCRKLDKLWEENEGCEVLFTWTSFLSEEVLNFLELGSPIDLTYAFDSHKNAELDLRAIQDIGSKDLLLPALLEYSKQKTQHMFEKSVFECKVCFAEKFGSSCINFQDCDHVYCKDCMKDYFRVQIEDGNVLCLSCPEDKCESQAHPSQVKELVSEDLFQKYDKLLLQNSLDRMLDVIYCPRPSCQYPVLLEKEGNMGSCPNCNYVFCTLCKLVFHGLSPCRVKAEGLRKLKEEWEAATEEGRILLEKRYGKQIIKQALEETFTNQWLEEFAKKCPSCGANIQKIDGCNKMTCMKCRAYFCWLCMESLSRNNPYKHFNTPGSQCNNRLFEGMDEMDDDDEEWMFML